MWIRPKRACDETMDTEETLALLPSLYSSRFLEYISVHIIHVFEPRSRLCLPR